MAVMMLTVLLLFLLPLRKLTTMTFHSSAAAVHEMQRASAFPMNSSGVCFMCALPQNAHSPPQARRR
jgi:hypothetical protein